MLGPFRQQLLANSPSAHCGSLAACPRLCAIAAMRLQTAHSIVVRLETGMHPAPSHQQPPRSVRCYQRRANETPEQAQRRRLRESDEVEQRVKDVNSVQEWNKVLQDAGSKLVVIEVRCWVTCMGN